MDLTDREISRLLLWAGGCDGESYIDERDWPLIEKLAAAVGVNPATVVPNYALDSNHPPDVAPESQALPAFVWSNEITP